MVGGLQVLDGLGMFLFHKKRKERDYSTIFTGIM